MHDGVILLAVQAHQQGWRAGSDVSVQTRRSNAICRQWQKLVKDKYPDRFKPEHRLNKIGRSQQIDLVDLLDRVAYELKASPNNVHMEIYRDVFKVLVFNLRNPEFKVRKLVFIAPTEGIRKLGETFPGDVQTISRQLGLELVLHPI